MLISMLPNLCENMLGKVAICENSKPYVRFEHSDLDFF